MVKGVTRQVIVVHSPGEEIFDQAIFILKDKAVGEGITDEKLMQEAKMAIRETAPGGCCPPVPSGPAAARQPRPCCG